MCYGGDIAWNRTWGYTTDNIFAGEFWNSIVFVVNGYLLSQKYIDFKFANEKLCKYFKFMLLWAVICGIPFQ